MIKTWSSFFFLTYKKVLVELFFFLCLFIYNTKSTKSIWVKTKVVIVIHGF